MCRSARLGKFLSTLSRSPLSGTIFFRKFLVNRLVYKIVLLLLFYVRILKRIFNVAQLGSLQTRTMFISRGCFTEDGGEIQPDSIWRVHFHCFVR